MNLPEAVTEFLGLVRVGSQALEHVAANELVSIDGTPPYFDQIKFHIMRIEEITEELAVQVNRQGLKKPL